MPRYTASESEDAATRAFDGEVRQAGSAYQRPAEGRGGSTATVAASLVANAGARRPLRRSATSRPAGFRSALGRRHKINGINPNPNGGNAMTEGTLKIAKHTLEQQRVDSLTWQLRNHPTLRRHAVGRSQHAPIAFPEELASALLHPGPVIRRVKS